MKVDELLKQDIEIKNSIEGSFRGGYDGVLIAKTPTEQIGYLQYSMYREVPAIKMIWVAEKYRRYGVAKKLLKALQEISPNEEIDWGYTTDDGSKLRKSIEFIKKPNTDIIKKYQKLTGIRSKLKKINFKLKQLQNTNPELARKFVQTVGDRWNKLNDLEYRLQNELSTAKGEYSKLIPEDNKIQPDMFPDEFATKRTIVKKEVPVSSRGATQTIKLPNVNSLGRVISPVKQSLQNFWNWFDGSIAVDRKGRPLVFFHGTNSDFSEFKTHIKTYNSYGIFGIVETVRSAIFVTPENKFAHNYVRDEMAGSNIISVYVKSEHPFDLRQGLSNEQWEELQNAGYNPRLIHHALNIWEIFDDPEGDHFVNTMKKLGYDSVIINEEGADVWALFSSTQLKAVYGNVGTYDTSGNLVKENSE